MISTKVGLCIIQLKLIKCLWLALFFISNVTNNAESAATQAATLTMYGTLVDIYFTLFSYCVEGLSSRSLVSSQQVSGHPPNGEFQSCNISYSIIINYCISVHGPQNTLLYAENGLLYLKICLSNNVFAIGIKISDKWNEVKYVFQHNASAHSLISSSRGSTCPQCGILKST